MAHVALMLETTPVPPSDADLMARLARGEVEPLGELYLRHGRAVIRVLGRALAGTAAGADLEDLCHEVFLTAHRLAPRYEEMGKLRSWLFRIAFGKARGFRRKSWIRRRAHGRIRDEGRAGLGPAVVESPSTQEVRQQIGETMAALSPDQREVLILAVGEGMSGKQIAETLGISHNAVRARLHRGRAAIQSALRATARADCGSEDGP
jgi:RNA polymerase sigma-70 factor (ECF subfamily)